MITTNDVAVSLGRPRPTDGSSEAQQWEMWISDAMFLIRARLGDLSLLDSESLDYVVRESVRAMVMRPDDATQVDISVDDGRVSKMYQSSHGKVFIRSEWWDLLSPTAGVGAFSIGPVGRCW